MTTKTNIKVDIVESPNWRHGAPKDSTIPKKLVAITPLNLFRCCITDKDYENIKRKFHEADLQNIKNLKNAETPFLVKDIIHTISLLDKNFPEEFKPLLRRAVLNLIDKNSDI